MNMENEFNISILKLQCYYRIQQSSSESTCGLCISTANYTTCTLLLPMILVYATMRCMHGSGSRKEKRAERVHGDVLSKCLDRCCPCALSFARSSSLSPRCLCNSHLRPVHKAVL